MRLVGFRRTCRTQNSELGKRWVFGAFLELLGMGISKYVEVVRSIYCSKVSRVRGLPEANSHGE